jgi:hypothetical protein
MPGVQLTMDVLGWCGALAVLLAYGLVSTRRAAGDSLGYQSLNIGGALLLLANTAYQGAYPSSFVNAVWTTIGVVVLLRRGERKRAG